VGPRPSFASIATLITRTSWLALATFAPSACSRSEPPSASKPVATSRGETPDAASSTAHESCSSRAARVRHAVGLAERRSPNALVAVEWPGCARETFSLGAASLSPSRPFRMASLEKAFVATLALRATRSAKGASPNEPALALDAPLDRFAHELPALRGTTLRALLTHTSGLFSYEKDAEFLRWQQTEPRPKTPDELVRLALTHTPSARKSAPYGYSNTGYVLVARLLELVHGTPLATLLDRELLTPLALVHTRPERGDEPLVPSFDREGRETTRAHHPSWLFGAGDLVTTLDDLARFTRSWGRGELLPERLRADWLRTVPTGVPEVRYGAGVFVTTGSASGGLGLARSHAGDVAGLHLQAVHFVERDVTVVAVVDRDGGDPDALVLAAARALEGPSSE
jgi:D-alanyl-D-alanine carboxypeptidase